MSTPTELQAQIDVLTHAVAALLASIPTELRRGVRDSLDAAFRGVHPLTEGADAAQARVIGRLLAGVA